MDNNWQAVTTLTESDNQTSLGWKYMDAGRPQQAEQFFKKALELREKVLPGEDPLVAEALDNLGWSYQQSGNHQEGENLFKRAMPILEKAYYADHYSIAPVASHLGHCYVSLNNLEQAEAMHKRAVDIYQKTLVGDHHDIMESTRNLAEVQRKMGKHAEAEALLKKAMKVVDSPLGPVDEFLFDLAVIYQDQNKVSDAETTYKQAILAFEQRNKPHRLATCLESYASFLRSQDRAAESEALEKRAKHLRKQFNVSAGEASVFSSTLLRA
jgi:tetratricopeptide (TPR) repeat protein